MAGMEGVRGREVIEVNVRRVCVYFGLSWTIRCLLWMRQEVIGGL